MGDGLLTGGPVVAPKQLHHCYLREDVMEDASRSLTFINYHFWLYSGTLPNPLQYDRQEKAVAAVPG